MKQDFNCPNCRAHLRADEAFSGRLISCPKCGIEFVIPQFNEKQSSNDVSFAGGLLETNESNDSRAPSDETTLLPSNAPQDDADDFDLATDVVFQPPANYDTTPKFVPPAKFDPPQPDPDDPMLVLFPDFVPNPFQISFPLDHMIEGSEDEDDEENGKNAPVNSKMPSVDELIN